MRARTPFQTVNIHSLGEVREFLRESMESEVHDFTQNGECSNCGACCSNALPMTETEIRNIRRYVKRNGIRECKRFLPVNGPTLDLTCPFRDNTGKTCAIYPARPAVCKHFQCDKSRAQVAEDIGPDAKEMRLVNVREEFFGEARHGKR